MNNVPQSLLRSLRRLSLLLVSIALIGASLQAQPASSSTRDRESRVESILKQMTLEEKIGLLGGVDGFFVRGLPRLGLPRLKMADGPIGVRNFGPATTMAAGIALAATWNPTLAESVGTEIGRDARAKGVHFLLGPGLNIYRAPMNGRNFEYLGEDPFLASRIVVGFVEGVQSQGVSATVKHFVGNNSEFDRHGSDSIIDERTLREIYLPAFEAAVKEAGVGAIMDAYNLVNGQHMSQNGYLNETVAKKEWGFAGIMMSDWGATYDAVAAANGGLDLEMPSGAFLNAKNLSPAIDKGSVTIATIDDKVRRIIGTAARFGWLDRDQTDIMIPRYNQRGRRVALQAARESMVLLKNEGNLLPLSRNTIRSVAVIGPLAYPAVPVGGGSARVEPFAAVGFMEGISNLLGTSANVYYHRGLPTLVEFARATRFTTAEAGGRTGLNAEYFDNMELQGPPVLKRIEPFIQYGPPSRAAFPEKTLSERWTGYYSPPNAGTYDIFVLSTGEDGGSYRLRLDEKIVLDNWDSWKAFAGYAALSLDAGPHKIVLEHRGRSRWLGDRLALGIVARENAVDPAAKAMAAQADVVVVAAGFDPETESEASDRTFSLPPGQNELVEEMLEANKNTIVVLTSGGAVDMNDWIDGVPALIQAWYPGQEGGTALAEVLFGEVNPSGRLPVTFERRWEDNPVYSNYYPEHGTKRVNYSEGVFLGYRGYERRGTKPLFPFGYGLSYTTFQYGRLRIEPAARDSTDFRVSFEVKNTGRRAGAEVAQVYVADKEAAVPRPPKELKGFAKVELRPGEKKRVSVTLDSRAFSYYDANSKLWCADPGEFRILIGPSSAQIELEGGGSLPPDFNFCKENQ